MPPYKEWPLWAQFAVMIALAAVIFFIGWKYLPGIQNQLQTITQLEEKLSKLQEEVRKGRILAAKEPELRREIAELQLRLEELKAIIPPIRDDAQLVDRLKSLADRSRLQIDQAKFNKLRDQEFYKEYPISMDVQGTYHDLAIFFDRLSRESRIFNVSGLSIDANKGGRFSIKSSFRATTFVFKEDDEIGQGAAKKPRRS